MKEMRGERGEIGRREGNYISVASAVTPGSRDVIGMLHLIYSSILIPTGGASFIACTRAPGPKATPLLVILPGPVSDR